MKKILQLSALLISIGFLSSCGSDDDASPPAHIVGEWKLTSYAMLNVPALYSYNEGSTFQLNEISLGIESYELDLIQGGSFERDVAFTGVLPLDDSGTWELSDDEEELTLISDVDGDDETFDVEKNENDDLWLSFPITFSLLKNSIVDTISQEYVDGLTNEEFSALYDGVVVDFVFVMEK
jgi:hypothetical protein